MISVIRIPGGVGRQDVVLNTAVVVRRVHRACSRRVGAAHSPNGGVVPDACGWKASCYRPVAEGAVLEVVEEERLGGRQGEVVCGAAWVSDCQVGDHVL